MQPFCDRLTVSVPRIHAVALEEVAAEYGDALGAVVTSKGRWTLPHGGTLYYSLRPLVATLEASGQACSALRQSGQWGNYLMALGQLPHRVTRLDAALDVVTRAAPVLHRLWAQARTGRLRLSRKSVTGTSCAHYFRVPFYPGEPLDTGTVWVPRRDGSRSDQYATIYDKRNERIEATGIDPGPLLRYEASAARGKGATLADAYDPTALFWHIMSPDILKAPSDASQWSPATEQFQVVPSPSLTPAERLQRFLDGPEGQTLLRLASFPGGFAMVTGQFRRLAPTAFASPAPNPTPGFQFTESSPPRPRPMSQPGPRPGRSTV